MTLVDYEIETGQTFASNNALIAVTPTEGAVGTASATFTGVTSTYDIIVGYYDESDGASQLSVYINDVLVDSWTLNNSAGGTRARASNFATRTVAIGYTLSTNDRLRIEGTTQKGERTRVDYIELVPNQVSVPDNTNPVAKNDSYSTDEDTLLTIALEQGVLANDSDLDGDSLTVLSFDDTSSAGGTVSVNFDGSFNYTPPANFTGSDSFNYTVSDGQGGSATATATIVVFSVIDGVTANYSSATNGIIANLSTGLVLAPIFGTNPNPTIMPLGDSITAGQHSIGAVPGGYRIQLWERFHSDGFTIDFVGSQSNGPASLEDRDHEGHGGWRINRIKTDLVDQNLFQEYPSDVILLMIGTNDVNSGASVSEMIADLEQLIDSINIESPNSYLVVSSIPPVEAPRGSSSEMQRINNYNAEMETLVTTKAADGYNIYFANAGGSLTVDDINGELDDGLHPTEAGYNKLGNAWYDFLVDRDQLNGIVNLIGSEFDDRILGSGDSNTLEGRGGNDWLSGTMADLAGANEQDSLFGGMGSDHFILGDTTQAYYTATDDNDYVVIQDFDASVDFVQLHGSTSDYVHEQIGSDRYLRWAETNELIAIFANTLNLNLLGSDFTFV
jgi:lysophospholipase L1-like esterase